MPVLQDEGNRVVVDGVLAANERHLWADELQRHAIICLPHIAGARIHNWYAVGSRGIETIVIRVDAIPLTAVGNLRDAQFI